MTKKCINCGADTAKKLIDLGPQPPSNRYFSGIRESYDAHPIEFGICTTCGLAQLFNPMPADVVRSRFEWISYNEPEGHLDDLVETLAAKIDFSAKTHIVGVTYKDESTLARFNRKGVADLYRLSLVDDLHIAEPLASLETIQHALSPDVAATLASKIGQADILLVRHIIEHALEPRRLLEACRNLCKPGGLMVIEVPDCRKVLDGHDHCFLWEEHISYFTPKTLRVFFQGTGFNDVDIRIYSYPMEDSLVAIVHNVCTSPKQLEINTGKELARMERFVSTFSSRGMRIKQYLQALRSQGKRVALFGAGHLAAKFINFYGLAEYLMGVIDDNPNKIGLYMPGSKLPIIGSDCLMQGKIDLCLLTLNPESEKKVLKANAEYLTRGGKFRSIFSSSANSINQDVGDD